MTSKPRTTSSWAAVRPAMPAPRTTTVGRRGREAGVVMAPSHDGSARSAAISEGWHRRCPNRAVGVMRAECRAHAAHRPTTPRTSTLPASTASSSASLASRTSRTVASRRGDPGAASDATAHPTPRPVARRAREELTVDVELDHQRPEFVEHVSIVVGHLDREVLDRPAQQRPTPAQPWRNSNTPVPWRSTGPHR